MYVQCRAVLRVQVHRTRAGPCFRSIGPVDRRGRKIPCRCRNPPLPDATAVCGSIATAHCSAVAKSSLQTFRRFREPPSTFNPLFVCLFRWPVDKSHKFSVRQLIWIDCLQVLATRPDSFALAVLAETAALNCRFSIAATRNSSASAINRSTVTMALLSPGA